MRWVLMLLGIAGCRDLLGIDEAIVGDAATEDGAPDAACTESTLVASADTMLVQDGPACGSIRFGAAEILDVGLVGMPAKSRVLLRFGVPDDFATAIGAGGGAVSLQLEVTLRSEASECGGTCPNQPGTILVFPMRSDWTEGATAPYDGASWCARTQTTMSDSVPWEIAGVDGSTDRATAIAGTFTVTPATATAGGPILAELGLDAQARDSYRTWRAAGQLSFVLVAGGDAVHYLASRETSPNNGTDGAARLLVRTCAP